jgi:hypothetical protein
MKMLQEINAARGAQARHGLHVLCRLNNYRRKRLGTEKFFAHLFNVRKREQL